MRDDMARVIVERPRIPAHKARKGRRQALEDLPHHEGMRRGAALHGDCKEFNENLKPLRRYLEKQVGRPWSKVYSEIAAHLRMDSTVQQHVRDHLRDFVAVEARRGINSWRGFSCGLWYQRLYVDPLTGLLCRTDQLPEEKARRQRMRQRSAPPADRIALAQDRELRRIEGLWYEVRLAPLPSPEYRAYRETVKRPLRPYGFSRVVELDLTIRRLVTPAVRDAVTRTLIDAGPPVDDQAGWREYRRAHPDRRYAVAKRALSRRELRRHGLSNQDEA